MEFYENVSQKNGLQLFGLWFVVTLFGWIGKYTIVFLFFVLSKFCLGWFNGFHYRVIHQNSDFAFDGTRFHFRAMFCLWSVYILSNEFRIEEMLRFKATFGSAEQTQGTTTLFLSRPTRAHMHRTPIIGAAVGALLMLINDTTIKPEHTSWATPCVQIEINRIN